MMITIVLHWFVRNGHLGLIFTYWWCRVLVIAKDIVIECNSYNYHVHKPIDCTGWTFLHRLAIKDNLIIIALMAILKSYRFSCKLYIYNVIIRILYYLMNWLLNYIYLYILMLGLKYIFMKSIPNEIRIMFSRCLALLWFLIIKNL